MESMSNLLVILAWIISTAIPAVVAIWRHLRAKAYKRACQELIETIEKYDQSGDVKRAVTAVVSSSARRRIINPYLKRNGYAKSLANDRDSNSEPSE